MSSRFAVDAATAFVDALTVDRINDELWPWVRLRPPAGLTDLASAGEVRLGEPLCDVWLLLFGILPLDRMRIVPKVLDDSGPRREFMEESELLWVRRWHHHRIVEADGAHAVVTDRLVVEPRIPGFGPVARRLVAGLFRSRHRRLLARYGG